jgi:hypothetical protein
MRKVNNYLFIIASLLLTYSCKKDADQYDLHNGAFAGNALTASVPNAVLTAAKENDTAVVFTWQAADYGKQPVVTYILQLAMPADTANNWALAKNYPIGSSDKRLPFLVKDLNNLLNGMGLAPGVASTIAVRVQADLNPLTGGEPVMPTTYTNTVVQPFTPYGLKLFVPGDYQNWDPASAPQLAPVNGRAGLYEGYVYIAGSGQHYFKYTNSPDWNHTNYGDGGGGSFNTDGAAGGLSVPDGGYYYLTANLNNNTWTATKTVWGILGDATPGGWDADTHLAYNETTQVWTVTCNMKTNGSFKFRANEAWTIDFGIDNTGKLTYADNPFLGYTPNLNNLTVPQDGNYTITLDLHEPGNYTYNLHKN